LKVYLLLELPYTALQQRNNSSKEPTMLTVIENLPAAIALTGLVLRLYLGGKPSSEAKE
jgi:hypothetical protein